MSRKKIIYIFLSIILVLDLILAGIIFSSHVDRLKIVFLDVGQGDSILISQGKNQIIIDGGPSEKVELEKLGKYVPFWDRQIEALIATHPDQDHIDGLVGVMKNYAVQAVVDNGMESDSKVYKNYIDVIKDKNIPRLTGTRGMKLKIGETVLEILYPSENSHPDSKDTNAGSIVAKLTRNKNSFLLTGDFPTKKDQEIFSSDLDLSAQVLKVAHHGSKYSTSQEFLEKVNPEESIISVGAKNRYGHPAEEVISRLRDAGIRIMRTDLEGDIEYDL